jgi:dTDP-4-amino-4,6-dideoxygalactose transaminase
VEIPQELSVIVMTEHETTPSFKKNGDDTHRSKAYNRMKTTKAVFTGNPLLLSYQNHKEEIDTAIMRVLESGWYILGEEVRFFEEEFARYIGVNYGIGVGSGTDAITLALKACGIGPGDEVITVSHTAVATVAAIELSGAMPVLVDISPDMYTLDPDQIEEVITPQTKAILPVHLYGHSADMDRIVPIAEDHDLYVIEDCAQSHGGLLHGRKTGSLGDIAAFSFYPTKNLGAIGDGGMVVTDDADLAEQVRLLRQYGWKDRNMSTIPGMNSRLDEIQAAILRVKLQYLDDDNLKRRDIARVYGQILPSKDLVLPIEADTASHVYHQYVIRTPMRDALRTYLTTHGVETSIHYPVPVHLQPAYRERLINHQLSRTETICREILSLPMHPYMEEHDASVMSILITGFFGSA